MELNAESSENLFEEMPVIKYKPEDFQVREVLEDKIKEEIERKKQGQYGIYILKRKSIDAITAIKTIANELSIPIKYISFSGTKDKKALIQQYISIKSRYPKELIIKKKNGASIELKRIGFANKPISLGEHKSNEFEITIRNLSPSFHFPEDFDWELIPNYFHNQRFGIQGNNHIIGEAIIKRKYEEAIKLIKEQEAKNKERIEWKEKGENAIVALRKINKRLITFYVSAFQSYLFNNAISKWIKENFRYYEVEYIAGRLAFIQERITKTKKRRIVRKKVMLPGFGFEPKEEIEHYILREISEHGLKPRDFIIREIPYLSGESVERALFIPTLKIKEPIIEKDEHFNGKNKMLLRFTLGKGAYATVLISALCRIQPSEP